MTTLYADIDVKGSTHAQKDLPETIDEAVSFLNNLKIKPSIVVRSGNGIYGYWLLDKPFKINSSEDKNRIVSVFGSFGKYINLEAKKRGWKLDNVYDLARILRVPGSINYKLRNGVKCEVIESSLKRYSLDEFSQGLHCNDIGASISKTAQGVDKVFEKCEFIKYYVKNAAKLF